MLQVLQEGLIFLSLLTLTVTSKANSECLKKFRLNIFNSCLFNVLGQFGDWKEDFVFIQTVRS